MERGVRDILSYQNAVLADNILKAAADIDCTLNPVIPQILNINLSSIEGRRDRPSDRNSDQLSSSSYQLLDLSVLFNNFIFLCSVWSDLGSTLLIIQFPLLLLSCHLMKSFRMKIQRNDMIRVPRWSRNIPTPSENERNACTDTSTNGSIDLITCDNNM